jgi:mannose-6-phosphate isomerase-like protein (cupin superfamily)
MGMADDTNYLGKKASCAGGSNIIILHSEEFKAVVGDAPLLVKVVEIDAHEGPVYIPEEDALYFTTLPQPTNIPLPGSRRVAIKRLALNGDQFPVSADNITIVREPANMANGMALDREGRLVICEQGTRIEHARDTDIMYVVEGNATVVIDGEMVNSRYTAPGEIRADSIKDGVTHKLSPGDVLVIPKGWPHQFVKVSNPFLYYVVKAPD